MKGKKKYHQVYWSCYVEYSRKDHHEKDLKRPKSVPTLPSKSLTIQKPVTVSNFAKSFFIDDLLKTGDDEGKTVISWNATLVKSWLFYRHSSKFCQKLTNSYFAEPLIADTSEHWLPQIINDIYELMKILYSRRYLDS